MNWSNKYKGLNKKYRGRNNKKTNYKDKYKS